MGSSSPILPSSTSFSIAVTVKVLVSLPIRMLRPSVMGAPVALSATPKARRYSPLPGADRATCTPGTLASSIAFRMASSNCRATAGVSCGKSSETAGLLAAGGVGASTAYPTPAPTGTIRSPTAAAPTAALRNRVVLTRPT